ncbi:MAG: hydantoinase B/oxoprolinase family protein [Proteobacteria bacterium]|nr:hydantoinase B/oxoprolinase family protein [Pseudomonadota bacterium]
MARTPKRTARRSKPGAAARGTADAARKRPGRRPASRRAPAAKAGAGKGPRRPSPAPKRAAKVARAAPRRKFTIDPVARELIKNALVTIADNMVFSVIRTSRSTVVKQNLDFSAGILDSAGQLVAQGLSLPPHLGAMMPALDGVLKRFRHDIRPGDLFINNDPYEGGSHLNDIFAFKPVFAKGELICFNCVIAHHTDMGGRVPGGNASDSMEIYQEGFRIPPIKLYEGGKLNETFMRIMDKNVRMSVRVLGDLRAQVAAVNLAEKEMLKFCGEHDVRELKVYMQELIDYAERLTRASIAKLPDGDVSFTDYMDDNGVGIGPMKIQLRLIKKGDEVTVDYTGTSAQCGGALNPNIAFTRSCTYAGLRCVLDLNVPNNAGFYKPITVIAPEGTFVNPLFPAALGARGATGYRLRHAVMGLLAQLMPERMQACPGGSEFAVAMGGYFKDRTPFMSLEFHNTTGAGGGPDRDGQDGSPFAIGNLANTPMELIEAEAPVRYQRYGFLPDTDGAGKYRGCLGIVREYRFLADEATVQVRCDREFNPPWGLLGGQPASPQRSYLNPETENKRMPSKFIRVMKKGEVFRSEMPGGGGYGNPFERDAKVVAEDVRQGKLTLKRARDAYGVAVDPATFAVDEVETRRLRSGAAAA